GSGGWATALRWSQGFREDGEIETLYGNDDRGAPLHGPRHDRQRSAALLPAWWSRGRRRAAPERGGGRRWARLLPRRLQPPGDGRPAPSGEGGRAGRGNRHDAHYPAPAAPLPA